MRSIQLALRGLIRSPFFAVVAIASLALGIGANTAIYSLMQRFLLAELPVHDPERLVNLASSGPNSGWTSCNNAGGCDEIFSYPMFRDLERSKTAFSELAAHRSFPANIAYQGHTLDGEGLMVSGSYFSTLGLTPARGRLLGPSDDRTIGGHFVAVLSHRYWRNELGGDPSVIDRTIVINGQTFSVVGIAPAGFDGTTLGVRPKVFVPITMHGKVEAGWDAFENRSAYWAYLFGRLQPGIALSQAKTIANSVYRPIINDVEAPLLTGSSDAQMKQFRAKELLLADGRHGQSQARGDARIPLLLLFTVTGIVLLIAAVNVANLLVARSAARAGEIAVRTSLGARRGQLIAQLLTESLLLAAIAGVVSLGVARATLGVMVSYLPTEAGGAIDQGLDLPVLGFTALLSLGVGLLFGLIPAIHATRPDLGAVIKTTGGKTVGQRSNRFRNGLVTAQIALATALLCSAALFIKSLVQVSRLKLGLDSANVITFAVAPERNGYDPGRRRVLFRRIESDLAAIPGVTAVTAGVIPVLSGSNWGNDVLVEGFSRDPDVDDNSRLNVVGPQYFRTLGMSLLAGREFTAADEAGTAKVAIVNEAFAKKFNLGDEVVGKRIGPDNEQGELDHEIVGLVKDAAYSEVKGPVPPLYFLAYRQDTTIGALTYYVRTASQPEPILRAVQQAVARIDPNLPVAELKTLPQQIRENVFIDRVMSTFSTAFALLATFLAAIGLYGVLAYAVTQRTREIGVRMALGADAGRVRGMVLRQVGWLTAIGAAIGVVAALGIGRGARSLLYEVKGHDPLAFVAAVLALSLVALGAGYLPARRASRVHPMEALRSE